MSIFNISYNKLRVQVDKRKSISLNKMNPNFIFKDKQYKLQNFFDHSADLILDDLNDDNFKIQNILNSINIIKTFNPEQRKKIGLKNDTFSVNDIFYIFDHYF